MIELIARLRSMADACKDATEAEAERIGEDHATLVPGVSGYFYDDLTAAAKALAASAQVREAEAVIGRPRTGD